MRLNDASGYLLITCGLLVIAVAPEAAHYERQRRRQPYLDQGILLSRALARFHKERGDFPADFTRLRHVLDASELARAESWVDRWTWISEGRDGPSIIRRGQFVNREFQLHLSSREGFIRTEMQIKDCGLDLLETFFWRGEYSTY